VLVLGAAAGEGGSGSSAALRTHRVVAGEMLLFNGRRSLHRVCTVGAHWRQGTEPGFVAMHIALGQWRIAALFSYSRQPGSGGATSGGATRTWTLATRTMCCRNI
jgi:hypothetical protein